MKGIAPGKTARRNSWCESTWECFAFAQNVVFASFCAAAYADEAGLAQNLEELLL
jgi:hypothetical protein